MQCEAGCGTTRASAAVWRAPPPHLLRSHVTTAIVGHQYRISQRENVKKLCRDLQPGSPHARAGTETYAKGLGLTHSCDALIKCVTITKLSAASLESTHAHLLAFFGAISTHSSDAER